MDHGNKDFLMQDTKLLKYRGHSERVVVPEGVTEIDWYAFSGCKSLQEITIPEGVTKIEESAFSGCKSLQEITIPESVTEIEGYTFSGCESLQEITIPKSVTQIGEFAFSGCKSLREIVIPEGVTKIGESAFSGCESLREIVIPNPVTEVGKKAFNGVPGKGIHLSALDAFILEDRRYLVREYLLNADGYDDIQKKIYNSYIKKRKKRIVCEVLKGDSEIALETIFKEGFVDVENCDAFFDELSRKEDTTLVATFLECQNKYIGAEDLERERQKKKKRALKKSTESVTELRKIWSYAQITKDTICLTSYKGSEENIFIPQYIGKAKVVKLDGTFNAWKYEKYRLIISLCEMTNQFKTA